MSSVFFRVFQHLLPRSRAWSIVKEKFLREFFEGLVPFQERYKEYIDLIYEDIDPYKTRELPRWEEQFQLSASGGESDRRAALDAAWKARGGQSPGYLQNVLRTAGFDVYAHEWWYYDGPTRKTRNPNDYLDLIVYAPAAVCGEPEAVCGEPDAVCGEQFSAGGYVLVNKGPGESYLIPSAFVCCGELDAVCGEPEAVCGETIGLRFVPKTYPLPTDPTKYPYFVYVGAEIFPDLADVPLIRKIEFERMVLKYFPDQLWIGMLINYT